VRRVIILAEQVGIHISRVNMQSVNRGKVLPIPGGDECNAHQWRKDFRGLDVFWFFHFVSSKGLIKALNMIGSLMFLDLQLCWRLELPQHRVNAMQGNNRLADNKYSAQQPEG
jgi:hypothetical protein